MMKDASLPMSRMVENLPGLHEPSLAAYVLHVLLAPRRAFRVYCGIGLGGGILLAMIVATRLDLSTWVIAAVVFAGRVLP